MGAELMALPGVEGALQQGAEDGGLEVAPIREPGVDEEPDLVAVQRQRLCLGEHAAVEAQHALAQDHREVGASVHVPPKVLGERHELGGVVAHGGEQVGEGGGGQQADVLGEQGEEAADEEGGGQLGRVAGPLQGDGECAPGGGRCRG